MATTTSGLSISIHRMVPSDGFESASVSRLAFLEDKAMQQQFLHKLSDEEIEINNAWFGRRFARICALPHVHAFKAIDDATGRIVGGTIFVGPENKKQQKEQQPGKEAKEDGSSKVDDAKKDEDVPAFINQEVTAKFKAASAGARDKFMGGTEVDKWSIQSLGVHPDYRRRGIAKMLIQKGLELVDADGMDCHVRSSFVARPAYANAGFEPLGTFVYLEGFPLATAMIRRAKVKPKSTASGIDGDHGAAEPASV